MIAHRAIQVGAEPVAIAEGEAGGVEWQVEVVSSAGITVGDATVGTDGERRGWLLPARKPAKFVLGPGDALYGVSDSVATVVVFRADAKPAA